MTLREGPGPHTGRSSFPESRVEAVGDTSRSSWTCRPIRYPTGPLAAVSPAIQGGHGYAQQLRDFGRCHGRFALGELASARFLLQLWQRWIRADQRPTVYRVGTDRGAKPVVV
jgi:hypothetical protein